MSAEGLLFAKIRLSVGLLYCSMEYYLSVRGARRGQHVFFM